MQLLLNNGADIVSDWFGNVQFHDTVSLAENQVHFAEQQHILRTCITFLLEFGDWQRIMFFDLRHLRPNWIGLKRVRLTFSFSNAMC